MHKDSVRSFFDMLLLPTKSSSFLYLVLLNVISNIAYTIYANSPIALFSMVVLAAFTAYCEMLIYCFIPWKRIKRLWLILLPIFHNILIITDYFLYYKFHIVLGQDVVDILAETNFVEAENFLATYTSPSVLILWILALLLLNLVIVGLVWLIKRVSYEWPAVVCSFMGSCVMVLCAYNFFIYRNGLAIPQYQTPTRLGYSIYVLYQRMQGIKEMGNLSQEVRACSKIKDKPTVVVVIGESYSIYHSSLFGYEKATTPLLQKRVDEGSLFIFDNAVSVSCLTHKAMESVFFLDSLGHGKGGYPFAACFKAAGYKTALYDNQYFVGNGVTFLSDKSLSELLYDKRNTKRYQYDMGMVDDMDFSNIPSLIIFHLWGQHYEYSQRYPEKFRVFTANDYDHNRWTEEQREIIAHYDNATRYNDFVVDQIIQHVQNQNSCVVYFSDHGEEIYEHGNFGGHGNAEHSKGFRNQIRVPLMVWLSPTFYRPELKEKLNAARHVPIMTDDLPHFLLDIAGIETDDFAPTRSFINDRYNVGKPRIVLHSIDYDKR